MKSTFSFFAAIALTLAASAANAQFNVEIGGPGPGHGRPGPGPGHPGHPGGPGGPGGGWNNGPDQCNAQYVGTWGFKGGRQMTVTVTRQWRNQVNVTLQHRNGVDTLRGTCNGNYDGSATLSFGGGNFNGNLTLTYNGQATGIISGYQYYGTMNGGGGGSPGFPGPDYSRCYGVVNGQWFYKGSRPMTLTIQQGWRDQVTVIVQQANGAEQTQGVCRPNFDGSVQIDFRGNFNFGNITIDAGNRVSGMVSNYGFQGFKN